MSRLVINTIQHDFDKIWQKNDTNGRKENVIIGLTGITD